MRRTLTALLAVVFVAGSAMYADAASRKKKKTTKTYGHYYSQLEAQKARQRDARTFDDTVYYERILDEIPLGTAAWWRQLQQESGGARN